MAKNIAIFVMSTFSNKSNIEYDDKSGHFHEICKHTNEVALKYMVWKLKEKNQNLDGAYAFVTDEADKDLEKFKALFADYNFPIEKVALYNNGDLQGSFKSVCDMFDVLQTYINENIKNKERVTIHIDMTGGPRHSVMLMLALIQMIKFSGADIGMVTYANILRKNQPSDTPKGMIEDTGDIMDMFTLISGAEEFNAFGNVSQIQKYFAPKKDITWCLNSLLDTMESFSETIKVCGSYSSMKDALQRLYEVLISYENFFKTNSANICDQEIFFSKLLPSIKNEYDDIMPHDGKDATPIQIIRWCAKREFLQQAVTFYTEWIPDYLIDSKLIEVKSQAIVDDCEKKKMEWSSWPIYLFRSYTPEAKEKSILEREQAIKISSDKLTYEDIKKLADSNLSAGEILIKVKGKNEKFETFIRNLIVFGKKITYTNFAQKVASLDENNPIQVILKKAAPSNTSFKNFLDRCIRICFTATNVVLRALSGIGKDLSYKLFDLEEVKKTEVEPDVKSQDRIKIFEDMLKRRVLITKLPEKDLLQFVANYSKYVSEWRNKFSHANSKGSDKESNASITKAIIDSVNLLEIKQ